MTSLKTENLANHRISKVLMSDDVPTSDLAGARTQDPLLKREMLYQLSYQVKIFKVVFLEKPHRYSLRGCKYTIYNLFFKTERGEI